MDILSIFNFLSPIHLGLPFKIEILPILFFTVIWSLFAWTIFRVYKKAKPENWENNWYGGNKGNNAKKLDAEHGSVIEISEVVATSSEKLADIMPGMILIIGLLGTFLGLGLALDKASSILTNANAISNMDSSMTQLMGMLEGLGTKFKTSTWGLLAFILLKVILSKNGYEERRLRWSIEKVKNELDVVRGEKLKEERANNQKLISCMEIIASQFERTLQFNQENNHKNLEYLISHTENTVTEIRTNNEKQIHLLDIIRDNHNDQSKLIKDQTLSFEKLLTDSNEKLNILIKNSEQQHNENKLLFEEILQQNTSNHTDQSKLIKYQAVVFEKLLTTANEKSDHLITTLEQQHTESRLLLEDNAKQSRETRNAMVGFIEKNEVTVSTLGKSAAGMSKAASTMGDSASHLQKVIDHFRTNMEDVVGMMKKDLNTTISGMNTSFSNNMTNMSDNLKTSIGDMSGSFKQNMSEMSKGLGTATKDISSAVNSLSSSVDKTMKDVTNTINKSMELQKESSNQFVVMSNSLIEEVEAMTGLIGKLSGDITGGLKAVSDSNRYMINVAKKTEELTNTVDGTFKESLQSIETVTTLKPALENLVSSLEIQKQVMQKVAENSVGPNQQKRNNAINKQQRKGSLTTKNWLLGTKGENN